MSPQWRDNPEQCPVCAYRIKKYGEGPCPVCAEQPTDAPAPEPLGRKLSLELSSLPGGAAPAPAAVPCSHPRSIRHCAGDKCEDCGHVFGVPPRPPASTPAAEPSCQHGQTEWCVYCELEARQAEVAALRAENQKLWSVRARGCSCVCHDDYESNQKLRAELAEMRAKHPENACADTYPRLRAELAQARQERNKAEVSVTKLCQALADEQIKVKTALARVAQLEALVQQVEWRGGDEPGVCPWCEGQHRSHFPRCPAFGQPSREGDHRGSMAAASTPVAEPSLRDTYAVAWRAAADQATDYIRKHAEERTKRKELEAEVAALRAELARIDAVMARRPALDQPTPADEPSEVDAARFRMAKAAEGGYVDTETADEKALALEVLRHRMLGIECMLRRAVVGGTVEEMLAQCVEDRTALQAEVAKLRAENQKLRAELAQAREQRDQRHSEALALRDGLDSLRLELAASEQHRAHGNPAFGQPSAGQA